MDYIPENGENGIHLVFVYGSLKEGFGNNGLLVRAGAEKLAEGITLESRYCMESMGGFPGVYPDGNESIWGELYATDDAGLQDCDHLEGHPHFYCRYETEIMTTEGEWVTAWMYLLDPADTYRPRGRKERVELLDIDGIKVANWLPATWERTVWFSDNDEDEDEEE